eukprot:TRINITY_DN24068_c0_g2_i1.p1 TRINITY_DN24068_c0_g2~~TRINITY_DN24068_c0_g2_i1.p1  ORF type:complete len:1203 (-),score=184.12 TRINITY_DN24068_c0_g2_i1:187-3795(-)
MTTTLSHGTTPFAIAPPPSQRDAYKADGGRGLRLSAVSAGSRPASQCLGNRPRPWARENVAAAQGFEAGSSSSSTAAVFAATAPPLGTSMGVPSASNRWCQPRANIPIGHGEGKFQQEILTRLQEDIKLNLLQPWEQMREPSALEPLSVSLPASARGAARSRFGGRMLPPLGDREPNSAVAAAAAQAASAVASNAELPSATLLSSDHGTQRASAAPVDARATLAQADGALRIVGKTEDVPPDFPQRSPSPIAARTPACKTSVLTAEEQAEYEVQRYATDQTLSLHYVLIGAENDIMQAAIAMAKSQAEIREEQLGVAVEVVPGRRKSYIPRTKGHGDALVSFIPNTMRQAIIAGVVHSEQWKVLLESPVKNQYNPVLARYKAALVFADASGFTKLTESLARQPQGAERIGATINGFFGPVIDIVHQHGGDIIKFSGDALTIVWVAEDLSGRRDAHGETYHVEACAAAARFCNEVQERIVEFGATSVPGCSLTMHIGVGFGDVALLQVGGLLGRWEYCVAGNALDQISIAEPLAASGETVVSPQVRSLLTDLFAFEDVQCPEAPGFAKLGRMQAPPLPRMPPWWVDADTSSVDIFLTKRYVPSAVALRLAALATAENAPYPEEMRRISVVFVSIKGLRPDEETPLSGDPRRIGQGRLTQVLMRLMQRSVYALEGSVNKFLVDDKGVLLLVAFGLPPLIHYTDDPVRAGFCGVRLCDTLKNEGLQGRVGIATGQCWCGVVGTSIRREYTILGDTVNLSARIMGNAKPHTVLTDQPTRDSCAGVMDFTDEGEVKMKGKDIPVRVYRFDRPKKGLQRHRKRLRSSLLTWDKWPSRLLLKTPLEKLRNHSGLLFITGPGGSGKTELVDQVKQFARDEGWNLLFGQNMDPSGTFALPRLCLQEAYREIIEIASRDPYWRTAAWKLLLESLEEGGGPADSWQSTCGKGFDEVAKKPRMGPPSPSEIFWMLIAMIRQSSNVDYDLADVEPWSPILGLVVTQLSFGPRMINAMVERNAQHGLFNRFAELCAAVVDGFSRRSKEGKGTLLLLHLRRSSSFFQSRDQDEAEAIEALASLVTRKRREANGAPEAHPLVVCIVSRGSGQRDDNLKSMAQECGGHVDLGNFDLASTREYVQHMLDMGVTPVCRSRAASISAVTPSPRASLQTKQWQHPAKDIVAAYIYEMTGGNSIGVEAMLKALEREQVIVKSSS